MELADVLSRRLDGLANPLVDLVVGAFGRVGDVEVADLDAVELAAELPDGHVALRLDAVDDVADVTPHRLDAGVALEERGALVRPEVGDVAYVHGSTFGRGLKNRFHSEGIGHCSLGGVLTAGHSATQTRCRTSAHVVRSSPRCAAA